MDHEGGKTVSLKEVVHRIVQQCYADLLNLTDRLSEMNEVERKQTLTNFFYSNRQRFLKVLVLFRWIRTVPEVHRVLQALNMLEQRSQDFVYVADTLATMHNGLKTARAPKYDVEVAIDVLSSGTYLRLPRSLDPEGAIVSSSVINQVIDEFSTHLRLRLLIEDIPIDQRVLKVEDGFVTICCENEYDAIVSTLGHDGKWCIFDFVFLFRCKGIRDVCSTMHPQLKRRIIEDINSKLDQADTRSFHIIHEKIHSNCVREMLTIFVYQFQRMSQSIMKDFFVKSSIKDDHFNFSYWGNESKRKDLENENEVVVKIDEDKGLVVQHIPTLFSDNGEIAEIRIDKSNLSLEDIIEDIISLQTRARLRGLMVEIESAGWVGGESISLDYNQEEKTYFLGFQIFPQVRAHVKEERLLVSVDPRTGNFCIIRSPLTSRLPEKSISLLESQFNRRRGVNLSALIGVVQKEMLLYRFHRISYRFSLEPFHVVPIERVKEFYYEQSNSLFLRFSHNHDHFLVLETGDRYELKFSLLICGDISSSGGVILTPFAKHNIYLPESYTSLSFSFMVLEATADSILAYASEKARLLSNRQQYITQMEKLGFSIEKSPDSSIIHIGKNEKYLAGMGNVFIDIVGHESCEIHILGINSIPIDDIKTMIPIDDSSFGDRVFRNESGHEIVFCYGTLSETTIINFLSDIQSLHKIIMLVDIFRHLENEGSSLQNWLLTSFSWNHTNFDITSADGDGSRYTLGVIWNKQDHAYSIRIPAEFSIFQSTVTRFLSEVSEMESDGDGKKGLSLVFETIDVIIQSSAYLLNYIESKKSDCFIQIGNPRMLHVTYKGKFRIIFYLKSRSQVNIEDGYPASLDSEENLHIRTLYHPIPLFHSLLNQLHTSTLRDDSGSAISTSSGCPNGTWSVSREAIPQVLELLFKHLECLYIIQDTQKLNYGTDSELCLNKVNLPHVSIQVDGKNKGILSMQSVGKLWYELPKSAIFSGHDPLQEFINMRISNEKSFLGVFQILKLPQDVIFDLNSILEISEKEGSDISVNLDTLRHDESSSTLKFEVMEKSAKKNLYMIYHYARDIEPMLIVSVVGDLPSDIELQSLVDETTRKIISSEIRRIKTIGRGSSDSLLRKVLVDVGLLLKGQVEEV